MNLAFKIEQIALYPPDPAAAIELLTAMGLAEWARDHVCAQGAVFNERQVNNEADLAFNYQATRAVVVDELGVVTVNPSVKPLELEVLHYTSGFNWMEMYNTKPSVSHLGMHVTFDELGEWRTFFAERSIAVAQDVDTTDHTNPVIAGKRQYTYVIFDTRDILGVDVKFIVRRDVIGAA